MEGGEPESKQLHGMFAERVVRTQRVLLTWHFIHANGMWLMEWLATSDGAEKGFNSKKKKSGEWTEACPSPLICPIIFYNHRQQTQRLSFFSWLMTISGRDLMITQRGKCVWFIAWRLLCALIRHPALMAPTLPDRVTAVCVIWLNWDRLGAITWCNNLIPLLSDWPDCASAAPNGEQAGRRAERSGYRLSRLTWTDKSRNICFSRNITVLLFCLCLRGIFLQSPLPRTYIHKRNTRQCRD